MVWLECPALREFLALASNSRYLNVAEEYRTLKKSSKHAYQIECLTLREFYDFE